MLEMFENTSVKFHIDNVLVCFAYVWVSLILLSFQVRGARNISEFNFGGLTFNLRVCTLCTLETAS